MYFFPILPLSLTLHLFYYITLKWQCIKFELFSQRLPSEKQASPESGTEGDKLNLDLVILIVLVIRIMIQRSGIEITISLHFIDFILSFDYKSLCLPGNFTIITIYLTNITTFVSRQLISVLIVLITSVPNCLFYYYSNPQVFSLNLKHSTSILSRSKTARNRENASYVI